MLTRSLIVAAVFACLALPLSGALAGSRNNSHNDRGATNHQASPGTGGSTAGHAQASKKKKQTKPAIGEITVTKTKDKASPQ